jgi:RNA polymerase sigma-70 factor (ECF subfamily)
VVRVDHTDDDAALMASFVKTRDRRVFEKLFQRHRRAMVMHATRFVRDRGRAEELAQEIFVRVYTTKTYEANAKFKTWLYRVATNVCLNELRKPEHQQKTSSIESEVVVQPGTPEDSAAGKELAQRLDRALQALPANQRAAFLMARQDNLSHEEIAEALSTSVSAVKSLIHRALESLRREVNVTLGESAAAREEAAR